jgi:hypothetical protein
MGRGMGTVDRAADAAGGDEAAAALQQCWDEVVALAGNGQAAEAAAHDAVLAERVTAAPAAARARVAAGLAGVKLALPRTVAALLAGARAGSFVGAAERRARRRESVPEIGPVAEARRGGEAELLRLAQAARVPEAVSNILVSRGSRRVMVALVRNAGAVLARSSLTTLVELAASDRDLKEALVARVDLPEGVVERLLPFLSSLQQAVVMTGGGMFGERATLADLGESETGDQVAATLAALAQGGPAASGIMVAHAREARLAALSQGIAGHLGLDVLSVANVLAGRLDRPVAILLRAAGADVAALRAVMDMRRACGCRKATETLGVENIFGQWTAEAARRFCTLMSMAAAERRRHAGEQPHDGAALAA